MSTLGRSPCPLFDLVLLLTAIIVVMAWGHLVQAGYGALPIGIVLLIVGLWRWR